MSQALTLSAHIYFERRQLGARKILTEGTAPEVGPPLGRVPRVAKLMALSLRIEELLASRSVRDYADIARLSHVTRARISQIANLRLLAPDIQEALLFLPRVTHGRDPVHLAQLQPIALTADWSRQRRMWLALHSSAYPASQS